MQPKKKGATNEKKNLSSEELSVLGRKHGIEDVDDFGRYTAKAGHKKNSYKDDLWDNSTMYDDSPDDWSEDECF